MYSIRFHKRGQCIWIFVLRASFVEVCVQDVFRAHWAYLQNPRRYVFLSSTKREFDPDAAYAIFVKNKTSDTALFLVITLTTFNWIVGASVVFLEIVHWWRHITHYDDTEAYRAICNILTVHMNNWETRQDQRGIPKLCKVPAKAGCDLSSTRVMLMRFSLITSME